MDELGRKNRNQDRKIRIFGVNLLTRDILVIKVNSNNKPRLPSHESTDK